MSPSPCSCWQPTMAEFRSKKNKRRKKNGAWEPQSGDKWNFKRVILVQLTVMQQRGRRAKYETWHFCQLSYVFVLSRILGHGVRRKRRSCSVPFILTRGSWCDMRVCSTGNVIFHEPVLNVTLSCCVVCDSYRICFHSGGLRINKSA